MLVVSATSSNSTLVPNANIVLGGTGTDRTIAITPAAGQSGTTTITVTVSDGISTSSDTFQLIVNPVGGLVDPVITITSATKSMMVQAMSQRRPLVVLLVTFPIQR